MKNNLVLGQYTSSTIDGEVVNGYLQEKGVPADSIQKPTLLYVAKLITGVGLVCHSMCIAVNGYQLVLRKLSYTLKQRPIQSSVKMPENKLIIRIQPDEGISMRFGLKKPGAGFEAKEVSMDFRYADLATPSLLSAYDRLLLDAIKGDATLFARTDAVHAC